MASDQPTLGRSPLCTKCTSIFTSEYLEWIDEVGKGRPHHMTEESLQLSASSGCYICARLREEVSEGHLVDILYHGISFPQDVSDFTVNFFIRTTNADGVLDRYEIIRGFPCLRLEKAIPYSLQTSLHPGTRSQNSMRQARHWIDQCCSSHGHSAMTEPASWLPTRLVCVDRDAMSAVFAKVCLRDDVPPGTPYLTLSHRWGNDKFLTLTSTVSKSWRERIPIEQLSRVFQDAFYVTHALGFSYIWIDSLCIVQDDLKDWEQESATMHRIYRGAACNLSATEFDSGNDGLVNNRRLHNPIPPIIHPVWPASLEHLASAESQYVSAEQRFFALGPHQQYYLSEEDPLHPVYEGPLFSRAWILQEQMLAARTLHFGKEQISWECGEYMANEVWPLGCPLLEDGYLDMYLPFSERPVECGISRIDLKKLSHYPDFEVHHAWKCIVSDFMDRDITDSTDRIPALAGLASEFHSILGNDRYRFGTWMNDPASLLWKSSEYQKKSDTLVVGVPSWSWARYERYLMWEYESMEAVDWTDRLLAQCLDTPSSDTSSHELHLRGTLLMPDYGRVRVHFAEYRLRELERTEESGGSACFMDMDPSFQYQSQKDSPFSEIQKVMMAMARGIPTNLRIIPIAKGTNWNRWNTDKKLHLAWCMVVRREPTLGTAMYTRVGTATLATTGERVEDLFPQLQKGLSNEDYLDMADNGTCTAVVV